MLVLLVSAAPRHSGGSPLLNLAILVVVAAVVWPLLARLRRSTSEKRRQRWQEEDRARGVPADEADRGGQSSE
jgi:hypothetical protein